MKGKLRHGALALTGVALVLAAGAAEAGAAQRFVAQGGTGVSCSQPDPCSIETGINDATANDEVIVAPGDYSITTQMVNSNNGLDIHGQAGGERPTITSGVAFGTGALKLDGAGVEVADLSIRAPANLGSGLYVFSTGALVERVDVLASGSSGEACRGGPNMTFRDSLCVATGSGATAFVDAVSGSGTFSSKLRNSTLIATEPGSTAIRIKAGSAGLTNAVDAKNVIARGGDADIAVEAAASAAATLSLTNSNYLNATVTGPGTATVTRRRIRSSPTRPPTTRIRARRRSTPA